MKEWTEKLQQKYNGNYISFTQLKKHLRADQDYTLTAACSRTKTGKNSATPKEFYVSSRLLRFYRWCEQNNLLYGILSDKYGIHWMDEQLDYYDIHPSELDDHVFIELGKKIQMKCIQRGITSIFFYHPSPIMAQPYFKMLYHSRVPYFYFTKLNSLQQGLFD